MIATPLGWTLGLIAEVLDTHRALRFDEIKIFDPQIEVRSHGLSQVVIEELSDHEPDVDADFKEEYVSALTLDEQFREQVNAMRLFSVRFNDITLMRDVLRCIVKEILDKREIAWIDTGYGWVISAQDFWARTDEKSDWDWRFARKQS